MKRLLALGSSALLLMSCTAPGPATSQPGSRGASASARPAPAAGAYAFPRKDTAYAQVAAEARRSGRPMLLYFWTSW